MRVRARDARGLLSKNVCDPTAELAFEKFYHGMSEIFWAYPQTIVICDNLQHIATQRANPQTVVSCNTLQHSVTDREIS